MFKYTDHGSVAYPGREQNNLSRIYGEWFLFRACSLETPFQCLLEPGEQQLGFGQSQLLKRLSNFRFLRFSFFAFGFSLETISSKANVRECLCCPEAGSVPIYDIVRGASDSCPSHFPPDCQLVTVRLLTALLREHATFVFRSGRTVKNEKNRGIPLAAR